MPFPTTTSSNCLQWKRTRYYKSVSKYSERCVLEGFCQPSTWAVYFIMCHRLSSGTKPDKKINKYARQIPADGVPSQSRPALTFGWSCGDASQLPRTVCCRVHCPRLPPLCPLFSQFEKLLEIFFSALFVFDGVGSHFCCLCNKPNRKPLWSKFKHNVLWPRGTSAS